MTTSMLITPSPITDGQKDQIVNFAEVAAKKAVGTLNLDNPAAQRVIARGDELKATIITKISELSLALPDLDCFSINDWQKYHRITVTTKQKAAIGEFPWSDALLNLPCPFHLGKTIRETHFAFVGLDQITIADLQKLYPQSGQPRFYSYVPDAWYSGQEFAIAVTLKFRWYLLLKDIVPGSENKTFEEQKTILPKEYEVPSAVEETVKDLLVFQKTNKYVNAKRYARTADLDSDGDRVVVGRCDAEGVCVNYYWDDLRNDDLGLSASRKFEKEP